MLMSIYRTGLSIGAAFTLAVSGCGGETDPVAKEKVPKPQQLEEPTNQRSLLYQDGMRVDRIKSSRDGVFYREVTWMCRGDNLIRLLVEVDEIDEPGLRYRHRTRFNAWNANPVCDDRQVTPGDTLPSVPKPEEQVPDIEIYST
jgi:hypothetical protein